MLEIVQRSLFELTEETHQLLREKEALEGQYIDVVVRIGLNILQMRPLKPYGEFIPWLEEEFNISSDTAYNYIHVAETYGNNSERVRNFPLRVVYALASPSTPQEVREMVETGQIEPTGKCPESSTVFALKHAHLPPIMNSGTKFPEQAASGADCHAP